jgi:hypothetical protein
MVDVALGNGCAKPSEQGTAAGVGGEWRPALTAWSGQPEELGVERVGEVVAERGGSGDGNSGLGERYAVEIEETLPGGLAAQSAGLGQSEFGEAEGTVEGNLLGSGGTDFGRLVEVVLCTHGG